MKTSNGYGLNWLMNGPDIDTKNKKDVIEFVAGGFLPPLDRDVDDVLRNMTQESNWEDDASSGTYETISKDEAVVVKDTLKQVYKHRKKNARIGLAIFGGLATLFGINNYSKKKKIKGLEGRNKELKEENDVLRRVTITKF